MLSQTLKITASERTGMGHDGTFGWWEAALEIKEKPLPPFLNSCPMPSPVFSIFPKISLSSEQPDQAGVVFPFADKKRHSGRWGSLLRKSH